MSEPKTSVVCSYGRAKERYSKDREKQLSAGLHLASAAEAGALVSLLLTSNNMIVENVNGTFGC